MQLTQIQMKLARKWKHCVCLSVTTRGRTENNVLQSRDQCLFCITTRSDNLLDFIYKTCIRIDPEKLLLN